MSAMGDLVIMLEELDEVLGAGWRPTENGLGRRLRGFRIEVCNDTYLVTRPDRETPTVCPYAGDVREYLDYLGLPTMEF